MDAFVSTLGRMSLRGIVIVFVVLLVRLLLKKLRISHKYILGLWAMTFLYFIIPWKLGLPVGFWNNVRMPEEVGMAAGFQPVVMVRPGGTGGTADDANIPGMDEDITSGMSAAWAEDTVGDAAAMPVEAPGQNVEGTEGVKNGIRERLGVGNVIGLLWMAGLGGFLGHMLYSYVMLKRRLRVSILYEDNIWWAEDIGVPMVFGLIRPRIYLPISMNSEDLSYVIAHERMHIKRKDGLFKIFAYVVCLIHWFNPFIWLAYSLFGSDMEKACDEEVLRSVGEEKRKEYAYTLLHMAAGNGTRRKKVFVAPVCFNLSGSNSPQLCCVV